MPWAELVDFWERYNLFLVNLVTHIPDGALSNTCLVAAYPPMSLDALIRDYVRHMQHHLEHILS
jgi:hypothetical protein